MIGSFVYWQFVESPKKLLYIIKKANICVFHYFSIGFLLKTLFYPWKRDTQYLPNPSLTDQIKILMDNFISRFIGFIVRFFTICVGLFLQLITMVVGMVIFLIWIFLPLFIIYFLYKGIA